MTTDARATGLQISSFASVCHCVICVAQVCVVWSVLIVSNHAAAVEPCCIVIFDDQNDWPVPLVELRTTHNVRFVSDNAGTIAFDLPELMGRETWFFVEGHGYGVKPDGFGYRGVRLTPQPGTVLTVRVRRQLPAKRLGRITGGGLFAESQQCGRHTDWTEQGILGCDSVQNVVHNGRLFWGWGDTVLPHYPLGRFHMLGATTSLRPLTSFEPPVRLRYDYVTDANQVPRDVARMPGDGPTWLNGYVSLPDKNGQTHLGATYSKIRPPLTEYERGLCVWNESAESFERLRVLWSHSASQPTPPETPYGHPIPWTDDDGEEWMLFGDPFPTMKCRPTFENWSDPDSWETMAAQQNVPVRGEPEHEQIQPHRGAVAWNDYRKKWVTVFTQMKGESSLLGEIWYAEADSPFGPWGDAVKVASHPKYTFYNPQLHPEFTPPDSPVLLFEGTYTHTFSGNAETTPRHEYNQVMYRLDLDEF
ncbi:MAG: hypothetical protein KDA89_00040 [Planctomycetaceae bacterium]|nr:hypothetical protein [Planctomycetaceae bacterium]